jgi:AGCS family alanine or glycine:cation symporter
MIGVFTDTIIICSASAMILLLAGPVPIRREPSGYSFSSRRW